MSEFLLHVATMAGIYAVMALGLNLQAGAAGLVNFGHVAFVGVGAYGAGIAAAAGLHPLAGLAGGVGVAALLAVAMARLGRQLGADYWGIATLAIAEILRTIALNEDWLTGGAQGIGGIAGLFDGWASPWDKVAFPLLVAVTVAACGAISLRLVDGRFGRAVRLMREEPALATSLGYDIVSLRTRATVCGAVMAAVGGALLTWSMSYVGPDSLMASETFLIWTMVMIGGLGNVGGVIAGAVLVQALYAGIPFAKDWLAIGSDMAGALRLGAIGVALLACLLWRSEGLFPERLRRLS